MVFPNKHLTISESLLGLGSAILRIWDEPCWLDELWEEYEKINNSEEFPADHSFDNFVLALDFLYSKDLIKLNEEGKIIICD